MKKIIVIAVFALLATVPSAKAQLVVSDPTNMFQGIINSINEMVHTSETATNMLDNFRQTVKIYEQSKEYYDKLRSVNNLVKNARKVQQCILIVSDISDVYINSYQRMVVDENFTVRELSTIAYGFSQLIAHSTNELADLQNIVKPTDMSMTDAERLSIIDQIYTRLVRFRDLSRYYARKNIGVSLLRAQRRDNLERTMSLYGTTDERYW